MVPQAGPGRANQKQRTRTAIVSAARDLIKSGAEASMPTIARAALVSEATAYRYFADLASLLDEAVGGAWPSPAEVLRPMTRSTDPVERVGYATEVLLRHVLDYQGAVRATIAASISRQEHAATRPGLRFGLIDEALKPVADALAERSPAALDQLKRDLAVVMSAEALFSLMDLCDLSADDAIASVVSTARTLTESATAVLWQGRAITPSE
jgi:AcrR family transcriptional regulator